jgi:PAS domain S-box-containing protein
MPQKSLESELRSLRDKVKEQQEELDRCKRIERSLRDSEEQYRFLVENSGDIIWRIDLQARWKFVSSNVEKVLGYKPDEVIGKTVWDMTVPKYHDIIRETLQERMMGKRIPPYEVEVIAKNGRHVPFEVMTTPIYDKNGTITGIQGISRDIEERKRAGERLKKYYAELEMRVEQRTAELDKALGTLETVLETVPTGIIVVDRETENITYVSPGTIDIFKTDITGKAASPVGDGYQLLRPDGTPFPRDQLPLVRSVRFNERVTNVEMLVRKRDGSEIMILVSSAPVLDPSGRIASAVASISDITYLKRTEAALRDETQQAELYIDLMGHDINNMNHIAMGYLEIAIDTMKSYGKLEGDQLQLLQKPLDMLENSSMLIDNVRKIRRIREGELTHEAIDLYAMLSGIRSEYSHIPNREVDISLEGTGPAPVIANQLLKDVFTNLVGNAIKHSTGPLKICIRLDELEQNRRKYYRVTIEDTGPGISPENKKKLLSSKKLGAKGLGLYLVRTFVKQFNGRFSMKDRVPGDYTRGARFVVTLPASSAAAR